MNQSHSFKLRAIVLLMVVCVFGLVAVLGFAALMGSGVIERNAVRGVVVVLGTGLAVLAILMLGLEALAARNVGDSLPAAPELATLTFHPAPRVGTPVYLRRVK